MPVVMTFQINVHHSGDIQPTGGHNSGHMSPRPCSPGDDYGVGWNEMRIPFRAGCLHVPGIPVIARDACHLCSEVRALPSGPLLLKVDVCFCSRLSEDKVEGDESTWDGPQFLGQAVAM
jgi:hypothetical protein